MGHLNLERLTDTLMLHLWSTHWPTSCWKHFRVMIMPHTSEIALQESNQLIADLSLQISLKEITVEGVQNILKPETLLMTYCEKAPFMFNILHTFTALPNNYCSKKLRKLKMGTLCTKQRFDEISHYLLMSWTKRKKVWIIHITLVPIPSGRTNTLVSAVILCW